MSHHEAFESHDQTGTPAACRVCTSAYDREHPAAVYGFCHHCVFKILILVVVVLVIVSYVAWYALF